MKMTAIWIDWRHARVFHFSEKHMERLRIRRTQLEQHADWPDNLDALHHERSLFYEMMIELMDSCRIVLLGPDANKHRFHSFLLERYPLVGKKVVGLETGDHPTDGYIAAVVKKHLERASD